MEVTEVQKIVCSQCFALLDVGDNYCRYCGEPTSASRVGHRRSAPVEEATRPATGPSRMSDNPWVVLAMMFLVLGPLGLPMLWRSRGFSPLWKYLLTAAMLVVVGVLIFVFWFVITQLMDPDAQLKMSLQRF